MRLRAPTMLLTRRIYLVVLILPGLILLHILLESSQVSLADSYRASLRAAARLRKSREGVVDDRVGWSNGDDKDFGFGFGGSGLGGGAPDSNSGSPNRDSIPGLGTHKSGDGITGKSSWTDFGQRLGRLTGVADSRNGASKAGEAGEAGRSNFFQRSGGSLYELVSRNLPGLYDARTSLDKLRLTSTRFLAAKPPSPYHVFSHTSQRQHILVTGGFSSIGRSLVRDLLLLGGESGADDRARGNKKASSRFGLSGLWGGDNDDDDEDDYDEDSWDDDEDDTYGSGSSRNKLFDAFGNPIKAKELDTQKGIIVTVLDTTNRSVELDDMLRHTPLYHRSRVGFNLPDTSYGANPLWNGQGNTGPSFDHMDIDRSFSPNKASPPRNDDEGGPAVEFVDPRSADFSSSEVSLSSFVAKGRLRIVTGDSRDQEFISRLLKAHIPESSGQKAANAAKNRKLEKGKFGIPKRPHYEEEQAISLPPVSGVFHLAGYETTDCRLKNARDCADMERNSLKALAAAVAKVEDKTRPWIVAGDRGNLEDTSVASWLKAESAAPELDGAPIASTSVSHQATGASFSRLKRWLVTRTSVRTRTNGYTDVRYMAPLEAIARRVKLHALSLRIPPTSHTFGDAFAPRSLPIPHLVHSAISHLPIVIDEEAFPNMAVTGTDNTTFNTSEGFGATGTGKTIWSSSGLVHVDDIVESLIAAGELLARGRTAQYVSRMSMLTEIDIVPPRRLSPASYNRKSLAEDTIDWIIQLTKSASPVGYVQSKSALQIEQTLGGKPLDRAEARKILGTTPSTPLPLALKAYIRSLLGRQSSFLDGQITEACAPPHDLRTLNDALAQLDTCSVQTLGLVSGEHVVLACNPEFTNSATTSPLVLANSVPYTEKLSQVKLKSKWGPVGKVEIGFVCPFGPDGADEQIVWMESTETLEGGWATNSEASIRAAESSTIWTYDRFEVNYIRRDMRSFTLSVLQYPNAGHEAPKRRMVFAIDPSKKGPDSTMKDVMTLDWQLLAETQPEWQTMEWRINPICCSEKQPQIVNGFTFLQEDPLLTSQVLYPSGDGSSTVAESTYELQRCRDLRSAHEYSKKLNTWNERTNTAKTCPRSLSEGSDWIVHDLPVCSINCAAPIACLVNDKCRCTRDRCGDEELSGNLPPQEITSHSLKLSLDYGKMPGRTFTPAVRDLPLKEDDLSIARRVELLPWDIVIQPSARQAFSLPVAELPKGHVVALPAEVDTHMQSAECYDVAKAEVPTMGDHYMWQALAQRAVLVEDADFAYIPYYQGCYYNYLKENTYKKLADTVAIAETQIVLSDRLRASNIVVPFTHDWGSCTGWWPRLEDVLSRSPPPPMSKAIAWQVNGDYNTRCVKAERDIIIPGVTKQTISLMQRYKNFEMVKPSKSRAHLAYFAGSVKGFGAFSRTRLTCLASSGSLSSDFLISSSMDTTDYLSNLGNSKFCLLPRSIAGWSTRAFDAIYAGCIPVFIADRTSFPFSSVLSYSAFSVSVAENEIHRLQHILYAISDEKISLMQIALLKVRDAFIFSGDSGQEWSHRGPLYFTLVEMAQKLSLQWPTLPVHNTCRV